MSMRWNAQFLDEEDHCRHRSRALPLEGHQFKVPDFWFIADEHAARLTVQASYIRVQLHRRPRKAEQTSWDTSCSISWSKPTDNIPPPPSKTDYYAALQLPRKATQDDITKAWRRLVLLHHPDKLQGHPTCPNGAQSPEGAGVGEDTRSSNVVDIRIVNEARFVLGDPVRRRDWEEGFFSGKHVAPVIPREPHITLDVSLDRFTPHHPTTESTTSNNTGNGIANEDEPSYYTYPCRCSAEFVITVQDLEDGVEVVGCSGCGEWLRVLYEVVEDETESPVA